MAYRSAYNTQFGELGAHVADRWPERTAIRKKGKSVDTLGLALSGGGYRSAIFNYGVLKGLAQIGVLDQIDYLSVVSGGSWIGIALATTNYLDDYFFDTPEEKPNYIEEGFESFLANPVRTAQELALARMNANYVSNVYGRLLARTFLREHGQDGRFRSLADRKMIKDGDRPFLIVNGTANFRPADSFHIEQECFEMTRLYCGSKSLGYVSSRDLQATTKPIRVRDAIAISGAAVAAHLPGLGDETIGVGLSREVDNYAREHVEAPATEADAIDVADGGFYNNLGVESLVNRGCGYIIVVDAEHDPERPEGELSGQKYSGLRTLLSRHHIPTPFGRDTRAVIEELDQQDEPVHEFRGDDTIPDILYIKLKSWSRYNDFAADRPYNRPGFFSHLFGDGTFAFNPQFSTAKLDYDFAEHRNLSELGAFIVREKRRRIRRFADRSQ